LSVGIGGAVQSECFGERGIQCREFVHTRYQSLAGKICGKSVSGDEGCGVIVGRETCGLGVAGGGVTSVNGTRADSGTESSDCCSRTSTAVSSDPEIVDLVLHVLIWFKKRKDLETG
jgi:hypothetical protein